MSHRHPTLRAESVLNDRWCCLCPAASSCWYCIWSILKSVSLSENRGDWNATLCWFAHIFYARWVFCYSWLRLWHRMFETHYYESLWEVLSHPRRSSSGGWERECQFWIIRWMWGEQLFSKKLFPPLNITWLQKEELLEWNHKVNVFSQK